MKSRSVKKLPKWTVVGYYPKLERPFGTEIGAKTAQQAAEDCLANAHDNWPPERQVVITAVVGVGGCINQFRGLLSSEKGRTVGTATLAESARWKRLKSEAWARMGTFRKKALKHLAAKS